MTRVLLLKHSFAVNSALRKRLAIITVRTVINGATRHRVCNGSPKTTDDATASLPRIYLRTESSEKIGIPFHKGAVEQLSACIQIKPPNVFVS